MSAAKESTTSIEDIKKAYIAFIKEKEQLKVEKQQFKNKLSTSNNYIKYLEDWVTYP